MLDEIVTQQAAMIAYLNDFKLLMMLTLAMIPLVLIIRAAGQAPAQSRAEAVIDSSQHGASRREFLPDHLGMRAERGNRAVERGSSRALRRRRRQAAPARSACRP